MAGRDSIAITMETAQDGGNRPSLEQFIECLHNDSLDAWAADIRSQLADIRRTATLAVTPHRDQNTDRARRIEGEIRKLQEELKGLAA